MKAVIDTSVFTDLTLKKGKKRDAAASAIARYSEILLLEYVLKEFKAGPLTYFYWYYRKLNETESFDASLAYLQTMTFSPNKYAAATIAEAHRTAWAEILKIGVVNLLNSAIPGDSEDKALASFIAAEIKLVMMRAWNKRASIGTITKKLPCYQNRDLDVVQNGISLEPIKCTKGANCCAHQEMTADMAKLKRVRVGIDNSPDKNETSRRRAVVKKMLSHPHDFLEQGECRRLGDAYIVFATPASACVLTTNKSDMVPLGAACQVDVQFP